MASLALRQTVFALYTNDALLNDIGFNTDNVYPNWTPDAHAGDLFLVLRWGVVAPGIARVNRPDLSCWVYNRQPDYVPIIGALDRIRILLATLAGTRINDTEAVVDVEFRGDSDDLYDDGYRAYVRYSNHTITASGS